MTNPKWLIGLGTAFILLTLLSSTLEGAYISGTEVSRLSMFLNPHGLFTQPLTWLSNLWGMLWFDYSFFHGSWLIFKYALFWPISFGLIVSFGAQVALTVVSGIRGLVGILTGV